MNRVNDARLVVGVSRPLDRDRLAERDRLLALADAPAKFLPLGERRDRAGLDVASEALPPREQLIAEAVVVELPVGSGHDAGLVDGPLQQVSERGRWGVHRPTALSTLASCSYRSYAERIRSRTRSCAVASMIGRSSAKLRRSPLTEY